MVKERVWMYLPTKIRAKLEEVADKNERKLPDILERGARLAIMVDEAETAGDQIVLRNKDGEEQVLKILI